ncbi:uncharacterized protein LOC127094810 [Lathyrus oleraceus]|uniref:uncharacterized protein LOC127094810 n=1 Tax=Pisum sativum TaxID=3888 RepID=UPI0021CF2F80|nr:uncharacterized protein LOC127094810 [Pisum sativum]
MLILAIRENKIHNVVVARNDVPVQGPIPYPRPTILLPNLVIYGLPPRFTPPLEGVDTQSIHTSWFTDGVATQGTLVVNQIHISCTDEELQDEYEIQNYHGVPPMVNLVATKDFKAILMCRALEKKLRVMEGHNSTSLSALEMCLVPNVVNPPKFKALEFEKYKGLNCPNIHIKMYYRKMSAYAKDDKIMIHCFQDSLTERLWIGICN